MLWPEFALGSVGSDGLLSSLETTIGGPVSKDVASKTVKYCSLRAFLGLFDSLSSGIKMTGQLGGKRHKWHFFVILMMTRF